MIIVAFMVAFFVFSPSNVQNELEVFSFEDCIAVGNPAMESHPRQCITPDGQHFTEDVGNELELLDEIMVFKPRPNSKVEFPLLVEGEVVGGWLFEAEFQVVLIDEDGDEIIRKPIMVFGDWMTDQFVPFKVELEFDVEPGKYDLVFEKANPSNLAENGAELRMPVLVE